ncbi:MAG TPA: response regulator [Candidatus Nanoarchaeia archaeon]|nr:response regulator [Candidatus Nanoarchaeia archaeon]
MAKKIMVVDDDADIRSTLKTVLEKNGFKVTLAVNGDDCLKKLKTSKPDAILSDIMMPGTQVREMVKQIKSVPIAFISVVRMSDIEKEELGKQKNVKDYIQKPFDLDDLIRRVKRLVENE